MIHDVSLLDLSEKKIEEKIEFIEKIKIKGNLVISDDFETVRNLFVWHLFVSISLALMMIFSSVRKTSIKQ